MSSQQIFSDTKTDNISSTASSNSKRPSSAAKNDNSPSASGINLERPQSAVKFDRILPHGLGYLKLRYQAARVNRADERRFTGNSISHEWMLVGPDADYVAHTQRALLKTYRADHDLDKLIYAARRYYVDVKLKDDEKIDEIRYLFDRAEVEEDPTYLVRAYTMETLFYTRLREEMASMKIGGIGPRDINRFCVHIAGIIAHDERFNDFSFTGICYRGMIVTKTELAKYVKGQRMMTKLFQSASILKDKAMSFQQGRKEDNMIQVLLTYYIRNERSGLYIEKLSEFPDEKEVLIMPYTAFKITQRNWHNTDAEIELKECLPW